MCCQIVVGLRIRLTTDNEKIIEELQQFTLATALWLIYGYFLQQMGTNATLSQIYTTLCIVSSYLNYNFIPFALVTLAHLP